jgi:hypothetical protein
MVAHEHQQRFYLFEYISAKGSVEYLVSTGVKYDYSSIPWLGNFGDALCRAGAGENGKILSRWQK